MSDVLFVAIVVAFFSLAAGAVRLCERIVGQTDRPGSELAAGPSTSELSASEPPAPAPEGARPA